MRATRGLSQEELGYRARLHRSYIGAIEPGEINPTFRVLLKLERGLAIPLSELIAKYEGLCGCVRADDHADVRRTSDGPLPAVNPRNHRLQPDGSI